MGLANGKDMFTIWMYEQSDLIQDAARAYGERLILEKCIKELRNCQSLQSVLKLVFTVYATSLLERDLGWYLTENLVTPQQGKQITELSRSSCAAMSTHAVDLVDAFQVPMHVFQAPIAGDWVKYNEYDNQGESKNYSQLFQ